MDEGIRCGMVCLASIAQTQTEKPLGSNTDPRYRAGVFTLSIHKHSETDPHAEVEFFNSTSANDYAETDNWVGIAIPARGSSGIFVRLTLNVAGASIGQLTLNANDPNTPHMVALSRARRRGRIDFLPISSSF